MRIRRPLAVALASSVAFAGLVTVTATGASGAPPAAKVQPRVAVTNTSAYAVVRTILVNNGPVGVAVNSNDDTVYVTSDDSDTLTVINGRNPDDSVVITVNDEPWGVAVDQSDDTVYVTNRGARNGIDAINGATLAGARDDTISLAGEPGPVAVDQGDDTIFVSQVDSLSGSANLYAIAGKTFTLSSTLSDNSMRNSWGLSVNDSDDSVYVSGDTNDSLVRVNGRTNSLVGGQVIGTDPAGVAVNQEDDTVYVNFKAGTTLKAVRGSTFAVTNTVTLSPACNTAISGGGVVVDQSDDTVYAACTNSNSVFALDSRNLDDTSTSILTPSAPDVMAVDDTGVNRGLLYVTSFSTGANRLYVIAPNVSPTLLNTSGSAGTPVTVSLTVPNLAPSFDLASTTVSSIKFGATNGNSLAKVAGTRTWSVVPPAGSGTVDVVVTFAGGKSALAGSFTYSGSPTPTPTPVYPPGAPTDVKATAGTGEATVSWAAPTYIGSYPITDYQVTSSTGSHTCLTKSTSCTLTGLTGGTSYTFEVRALNGAGWGAYSTPSNAVTPVAKTILITGSREASDTRYVKVQGTTTDLVGKQVTPYVRFPGQTGYTAGIGVQTVAADGTFTWQRKTGKKISVYFVHGGVSSNTIAIAAR